MPARRVVRSTSRSIKGRDAKAARTRPPSLREVYLTACVESKVRANSALAEMLPDKSGVSYPYDVLDLRDNYLGDKGVLPLTAVLDKMASVHTLLLSHNGLRNKGMKALCQTIAMHPSVRCIDVSNNCISEGAATQMEQMLRENYRITDLIFDNTKIDVEWRVKLHDLLDANRATHSVDNSGDDHANDNTTKIIP